MKLRNFDELLEKAKKLPKKTISIALANDLDVLKAAKLAEDAGIAKFILVGNKQKIAPLLEQVGLSKETRIFDELDEASALKVAVSLVRDKSADLLMKGAVNTSDFLRAVLSEESKMRTGRLLSHFAAYEMPNSNKLVFHTDTGMNILPNLFEKTQILTNALLALKSLGIANPKVAVLSANEKVNEKMQSSVDAQKLAEMSQTEDFFNAIIEGPIAMDVALDKRAAIHKGISSKISGDVDLFLMPSIECGNILGKALLYYTPMKMAGVVLGAKCPIVLTSRAESAEGKLTSIALACLLATND